MYELTTHQALFFREHGFIAFENLIPLAKVQELRTCAHALLAKRLKTSPEELSAASSPALFTQGYDLWRESSAIEKIVRHRTLLSLAARLFDAPVLRIAFDQLLLTNVMRSAPLQKRLALRDLSCIKPVAGGAIFALASSSSPSPMPSIEGHVLLVAPDVPLPWPELFATQGAECFLVVFAQERPVYYLEPNDPHALSLKQWGYSYGDLIERATHPILWQHL